MRRVLPAIRNVISAVLVCALLLGLTGPVFATAAYEPVTLTDQGGFEVTLNAMPERIAVAGIPPIPSFLIQFTGRTDMLVAVSAGAITQPQPEWTKRIFPDLDKIPVVGMGPNFEVEEILATNPDLIIVSTAVEEKYKAFRDSGIPTLGLSVVANGIDTQKNTQDWIAIFGQIFHQEEKAAAINAHIDTIRATVEEKASQVETPVRGLMMPDYSDNVLEVSNNEFFGGFWLKLVGAENVAKDVVGWEATMEDVLSFNPDVVYLSAFSKFEPSQMLSDSAVEGHMWSSTKAGETGRIVKFPVGVFNWYALSPDAPLSLLWIGAQAYPELYEDVDLTAEAKAHYALYGIELTDEEIANLLAQR